MNILFIGDIVGKPGRHIVKNTLPLLKKQWNLDLVIANAENAAHGHGITIGKMKELTEYGIDVFTTGNHIWADKATFKAIESDPSLPIVRAENFPPGNAGKGYYLWKIETGKNKGKYIAIVNLIGRAYMKYHFDCPFRAMDSLLSTVLNKKNIIGIFVDFHAETTAEKIALKHYLDGKVTALVGTHTHVATNDLEITKKGMGYITDVGMTGPYHSVIGMKTDIILERFLKQMPTAFDVADGPAMLNAVYFEIENGKTIRAEQIIEKER